MATNILWKKLPCDHSPGNLKSRLSYYIREFIKKIVNLFRICSCEDYVDLRESRLFFLEVVLYGLVKKIKITAISTRVKQYRPLKIQGFYFFKIALLLHPYLAFVLSDPRGYISYKNGNFTLQIQIDALHTVCKVYLDKLEIAFWLGHWPIDFGEAWES